MADYQFKIYYKLGKENITIDTLSQKEKYKNYKKVLYTILKENADSIISANQKETNYILGILKNNQKEFPILTQKLAIPRLKIQKCIAKYHNTKIGGYPDIGEILKKVRNYRDYSKKLL